MLNNKRHKSYETYIEHKKNLLMEGMEILIVSVLFLSETAGGFASSQFIRK